jgi:putative ABC transport system permease protein
MIKHLLKITWSRKRNNLFLMLEISIVFFVLAFFFFNLVQKYEHYWEPLGFTKDIENIYSITASYPSSKRGPEQADKNEDNIARLKNNLLDMPETDAVSLSARSQPYTVSKGFDQEVRFNDRIFPSHRYWADDDFTKIVGLTMLEGKWFNMENNNNRLPPTVITKSLANSLFQGKPAVGEVISRIKARDKSETEFIVVGVSTDYRTSEFASPQPALFTRNDPKGRKGQNVRPDVNGMFMWGDASIMVKIKPDITDSNIEEKLVRMAEKSISEDQKGQWSFYIYSLKKYQRKENANQYETTFQYFLLMAFLLLNIALGFTGIIYQSVAKRRSEIGIRRALGATKTNIYSIFLWESILVSFTGILLGLFFIIQLSYFNIVTLESGVFIKSIALTIGVILLVVIVAVMFPAMQAAKIDPAIALKDE